MNRDEGQYQLTSLKNFWCRLDQNLKENNLATPLPLHLATGTYVPMIQQCFQFSSPLTSVEKDDSLHRNVNSK